MYSKINAFNLYSDLCLLIYRLVKRDCCFYLILIDIIDANLRWSGIFEPLNDVKIYILKLLKPLPKVSV